MNALKNLRRVVAIHLQWIIAGCGALAIPGSVAVTLISGIRFGAVLFLLGLMAIGVSIQMARSLDIQRRVRKLGAEPAATISREAAPPAKKQQLSAPAGPVPGVDVAPGRLVSGYGVRELPVIAFDLTGMSEDQVRSAVDGIAGYQLISGSFKPVLLLDQPSFGPIRAYGYVAELIIAADEWQANDSQRERYVQLRLQSIMIDYGCAGIIRASPEGMGEVSAAVIDKLTSDWIAVHRGTAVRSASQPRGRTPIQHGTSTN